ncbi:MAG TPA: rod shape-determining protein MreD [Bacteroidales bacterium]|jgi:rod shape-determining protein MreD|nr:rod shape-determining protein MreD [Bacteroidales bacterium]HOX75943.1 rod shape-determining protein MreD [Bacteroidales bacterium]HPM89083.1 rod shape-determining protein MreD [Bacteroidales bacterium]HQM70882.1 rod shape-determining protein MreD [Bacteroidales bacterium]
MINRILRYALIFVLLLLLQLFLFNNIQFSGYVNPYVYILFILLLPVDIPAWLLLIISFFTGLIIDLLTGTPGMHTAATVLAGFARPYVLRLFSPREGYETGADPSMFVYGFKWFLLYTVFIVLLHHTLLFYLEVFRLSDFFNTFLRVLLSSIFSITFILLLEYIRKGK